MAAPKSVWRKRVTLGVVAVGSVLIVERVVALAGDGDGATPRPAAVQPRSAVAAEPAASAAVPALRLDLLAAREGTAASSPGAGTLFGVVAWQPPTPKAAPAAPPPKPVAPPFPYPYMGGLSDGSLRTGFFMKGQRVLAIKAGDVVDGAYRVDEMTDKQMSLTYLPLDEAIVVPLEADR